MTDMVIRIMISKRSIQIDTNLPVHVKSSSANTSLLAPLFVELSPRCISFWPPAKHENSIGLRLANPPPTVANANISGSQRITREGKTCFLLRYPIGCFLNNTKPLIRPDHNKIRSDQAGTLKYTLNLGGFCER